MRGPPTGKWKLSKTCPGVPLESAKWQIFWTRKDCIALSVSFNGSVVLDCFSRKRTEARGPPPRSISEGAWQGWNAAPHERRESSPPRKARTRSHAKREEGNTREKQRLTQMENGQHRDRTTRIFSLRMFKVLLFLTWIEQHPQAENQNDLAPFHHLFDCSFCCFWRCLCRGGQNRQWPNQQIFTRKQQWFTRKGGLLATILTKNTLTQRIDSRVSNVHCGTATDVHFFLPPFTHALHVQFSTSFFVPSFHCLLLCIFSVPLFHPAFRFFDICPQFFRMYTKVFFLSGPNVHVFAWQ